MNTNLNVDTRPAAGKDAITTSLTINWDGMTEEDLRALAQQSLVIKLQSGWRAKGIPAECNVNAVDYKVGVRAPRTKLSLAEQIAALNPADRAALIESLKGA